MDVDKETGREHLRCGPLRYAADSADTDPFFDHEEAGLAVT